MLKTLSCLLMLFTASSSIFAEDITYGELFLLEEATLSKNQINIKGSFELDNSIENVRGVELEYRRNLNSYLSLKGSASLLSSSKNDFAGSLGSATLYPASPKQSVFLKLRFAPFFGHINFMSYYTLPIEIGFSAGYGKYFYDGDVRATASSGNAYAIFLDTQFYVTEHYGVVIEIENLSRTQRTDFDTTVNIFKAGLSYRW